MSFVSYALKPTDEEMELYDSDNEFDEEGFVGQNLVSGKKFQPMWVLPLYSLLSSKQQAKVNLSYLPLMLIILNSYQ